MGDGVGFILSINCVIPSRLKKYMAVIGTVARVEGDLANTYIKEAKTAQVRS